MPTIPTKQPNQQHRVPLPPKPLSASPRDGLKDGQELARRWLPNIVRLFAGIALAPDSEAALHTKMLAGKAMVEIIAIPQVTPTPPQPWDEDGGGVSDDVSDGDGGGDVPE